MTHLSPIAGLAGPRATFLLQFTLIRTPEDDTTCKKVFIRQVRGNIADVVAKTGNYILYGYIPNTSS